MDIFEFSHSYSISKDVPFMFGAALYECLKENMKDDLNLILNEFAVKGSSSVVGIISEKKLKLQPDYTTLCSFTFKNKNYYLIPQKCP